MTSRSATNPIALRYVTEIQPCQEVAVPKASTRSATPNARLATASAARPISQRLSSATGGQSTGALVYNAGTTRSRYCSPCKLQYAAWCDALPDSLRDSATAVALQAIVDLDLDELTTIVPPRGYGRD
jgi:hypothetical protein